MIATVVKAVIVIPCEEYEGTWRYYTSGCWIWDMQGVALAVLHLAGLMAALWLSLRQSAARRSS